MENRVYGKFTAGQDVLVRKSGKWIKAKMVSYYEVQDSQTNKFGCTVIIDEIEFYPMERVDVRELTKLEKVLK